MIIDSDVPRKSAILRVGNPLATSHDAQVWRSAYAVTPASTLASLHAVANAVLTLLTGAPAELDHENLRRRFLGVDAFPAPQTAQQPRRKPHGRLAFGGLRSAIRIAMENAVDGIDP
jgi:hypothetical protein